ncbi:lipopolysaccharide assembly protein LapA domain-containing protein (plasmid) [Bacillus sp. 31A1R]|uniref:Lipopolysaccharide assembly protein LapA domain-containing protein n=1 Tax=Robertmurraya mangrovi TaxID=3098077 RepID=A0ABU5IUL4_9BACI|nr:lipopolysaccharide assembly protein LapA domain-containing protein [Bacillus sp. 31A1R]MDZ5470852.1 lipopolysaccharide assembly protein LapA domain-containing protein [Bacillus sp. 31A1R]
MKFQWTLIFGIVFALIVAIFAVINVEPVQVNYLFGQSQWPLILVILSSVLMGGLIIGSVGLVRVYALQKNLKALSKENQHLKAELKLQATKGDSNKPSPNKVDEKGSR